MACKGQDRDPGNGSVSDSPFHDPRMPTSPLRHDENHRYGKPGVHTMEKEFPMGYNKVVEAWNEYTQYTAGESGARMICCSN